MQLINTSRLLDGVVFSVFLLSVGGFGLFLFGELHKMCVITEAKKLGLFAKVMNNMFPFPDKKYEFNLTHVILFSLLIAVLSMVHHPAQDVIEQEGEKESKKGKKDKKAKATKGE
mmetsp:Transcript_86389/g.239569  ORF Transcript_86389/g.239569 Transcript_86389/m.239569 type:complete len:115 (-) Transcript_86389:196-540(-)